DVDLVVILKALRAHVAPPLDVLRLPMLERALQPLVAGQVDVVRDLLGGNHVRFQSNSGRPCSPYDLSAPFSPTALGRWKIQFCHAVSRPKIFVSIVSGPAKRRLASRPVIASGENAARASTATRTSSSQSISSGAKVTSPSSSASPALNGPSCSRSSSIFASSPRKRVCSRVSPLLIGSGPKVIGDSATTFSSPSSWNM